MLIFRVIKDRVKIIEIFHNFPRYIVIRGEAQIYKYIYIYPRYIILVSRKIPNRNSKFVERKMDELGEYIYVEKLARKNNNILVSKKKRGKGEKKTPIPHFYLSVSRIAQTCVHVTRLSPEVAVSRTGQHSSVILPIIYFHPLKRPRLRLQSGLPAALPFSLESRERLHSGDNRSTFQKGPLACSGHCLVHGR